MTTMKKIVNGEEVELTPEEVAEREAEEAAWEPTPFEPSLSVSTVADHEKRIRALEVRAGVPHER